MFLYQDFKDTVKDGDKIITQPKFMKILGERVVLYKEDCVYLSGFRFQWNNFFEVNVPISIKDK